MALDDKESFPIFHFTEELHSLEPQVDWQIIGKPMAMLDCHVAQLYGKRTSHLNQQVEQNKEYFKSHWRFRPTPEEWTALKSIIINHAGSAKLQGVDKNKVKNDDENFGILFSETPQLSTSDTIAIQKSYLSKIIGSSAYSQYPPWFYTKLGINMAAFFQRSPKARSRAIYIVEVFDKLEQAAFDPETNPVVRQYLHKILAETLPQAREEIVDDSWDIITAKIIAAINNRLEDFMISHRMQMQEINAKIAAMEERLTLLEDEVLSGKEKTESHAVISTAQAHILREKARCRAKNRAQTMQLWAEFKRKFGLSRYSHLPQEKFTEALKWIDRWDPQGKFKLLSKNHQLFRSPRLSKKKTTN